MRTAFSDKNKTFTDVCHIVAQSVFYPLLFGVPLENLEFVDTSLDLGNKERILDGEMAVDRMVKVTVDSLKKPIEFTIQERFRRPQYRHHDDITVTEWNYSSNMPSELYKLNAGYFVYGYGNNSITPTGLLYVGAVNTADLLRAVASGNVQYGYRKNQRSNQSFLYFKFQELQRRGLVSFEYPAHPRKNGGTNNLYAGQN